MVEFFSVLLISSFMVSLSIGLYLQYEDMSDYIQRYFQAIRWGESERDIEDRRSHAKREVFNFMKIFIWPFGLYCWLKSIFTPEEQGKDSPFKSFIKIFK